MTTRSPYIHWYSGSQNDSATFPWLQPKWKQVWANYFCLSMWSSPNPQLSTTILMKTDPSMCSILPTAFVSPHLRLHYRPHDKGTELFPVCLRWAESFPWWGWWPHWSFYFRSNVFGEVGLADVRADSSKRDLSYDGINKSQFMLIFYLLYLW